MRLFSLTDLPRERPSRFDGLLPAAGAVAVVLAVVLRVALLGGKTFWTDEAWVAWLAAQPFSEVLAIVRKTTAPVGFALVVKLCSLLPGLAPEVSLRLLPLAAGIATVLLLPRLVRALGGSRRAAVTALLISAAMPALVHYSRELKPYAIDALVATAFPLAALRLMAAPDGEGTPPRRRAWRWLPAVLAVATPAFSFGGVFVVAATLAWGWVHLLRRRIAAARLPWAAATAAFASLLALAALVFILRQATNPGLVKAFNTRPLQQEVSVPIVAGNLTAILRTMGEHQFPGAGVAALCVAAFGFAVWPNPGRGAAAGIAAGSILLAALAASSGLYAVKFGRLVLFGAPFLIAAVSVAVDRSLGFLARRAGAPGAATVVALCLAASLAVFWAQRDFSHRLGLARPTYRTIFLYDIRRDVPGLVEETVRRRGAGEPLLVAHAIAWPVRYYSRGRLDGMVAIKGRGPRKSVASLERWLPLVAARGWILLDSRSPEGALREALAGNGFVASGEFRFRGARLLEISRSHGAAPR